jgi:hypothetical protein
VVRTPRATKSLTPFDTAELTKKMENSFSQDTFETPRHRMGSGVGMMLGIIGVGVLIAGGILYWGMAGPQNSAEANKVRTAQTNQKRAETVPMRRIDFRQAHTSSLSMARRPIVAVPEPEQLEKQSGGSKKQNTRKVRKNKRTRKASKKVVIPRW